MLSKSAARNFFLIGTAVCCGAFILLTFDTLSQFKDRTHADQLSESAKHGFEIWTDNNCMGCHTILGEGSYYAPELTRVVERRGEPWMRAFLKDPASFYPGRRKMVKYDIFDPAKDKNAEQNITDVIAFFAWVQNIETNDFPPKPDLFVDGANRPVDKDAMSSAPEVFKTICVGCHKLGGQGGDVGPALDGIGARMDASFLTRWLTDPLKVKADSKMPKLPLTDEQVSAVVTFLGQQK